MSVTGHIISVLITGFLQGKFCSLLCYMSFSFKWGRLSQFLKCRKSRILAETFWPEVRMQVSLGSIFRTGGNHHNMCAPEIQALAYDFDANDYKPFSKLVSFQTSALYSISPTGLALTRLPALGVTLGLELVGGIAIAQMNQVILLAIRVLPFI